MFLSFILFVQASEQCKDSTIFATFYLSQVDSRMLLSESFLSAMPVTDCENLIAFDAIFNQAHSCADSPVSSHCCETCMNAGLNMAIIHAKRFYNWALFTGRIYTVQRNEFA